MKNLTDEELLERVITTDLWIKNFRFVRYWRRQDWLRNIRKALTSIGYGKRVDPDEFECTIGRLNTLIRAKRAKELARKHRERAQARRQRVEVLTPL